MLSENFFKALDYAGHLHGEDLRKGTEIPYVCHLLAVCGLTMEYGGSEHAAIAALLHDALEDHPRDGRTDAEIRDAFPEEVLAIVKECSQTGEHTKASWRQRKEQYVNHLGHASDAALLVSACDKLHNIRAIIRDYKAHGDDLWQRFNARAEDTLWYYRAVSDTLAPTTVPDALKADLETHVRELERLAAGR